MHPTLSHLPGPLRSLSAKIAFLKEMGSICPFAFRISNRMWCGIELQGDQCEMCLLMRTQLSSML